MIETFTPRELKQKLADKLTTEGDFVALAAAGEQLRRRLALTEASDASALDTLQDYDRRLESLAADEHSEVPGDLQEKLTQALERLQDLSARDISERAPELEIQQALRIDEILCAASAAGRCGRMTPEDVQQLAVRARTGVNRLAPRLSDLWEFAEQHALRFDDDPDHPGLQSWWEELARFSPSRLSLREAMIQQAAGPPKELVDRVVQRFIAAQQAGPVMRFVDRVKALLADVQDGLRVPVPQLSFEGSYSERKAEELEVEDVLDLSPDQGVDEAPESLLSIHRVGRELWISVIEGHIVEPVAADLGDGQGLRAENVENSQVVIRLPEGVREHDLHIRLLVDNELVELPLVRLVPCEASD